MPGLEEATTREQMETDMGPALQSYLKSELPESLSWPGKLNRKLCPPGVFLLAPDDTEKQRMYLGRSHSRVRVFKDVPCLVHGNKFILMRFAYLALFHV